MGGDGVCSESLGALAGDALIDNSVVCAEAGGVEDNQKKGLEEFKTAYKKKFDMEVQIYAPYVYDSVMLMVAAMQKANSSEPQKYLPELAKIQYKGVTGNIAFDNRGDVKDGTLTLYTYKGGKRSMITVTH
jgi:branched-chain amino acid transport system substrate-binding protein